MLKFVYRVGRALTQVGACMAVVLATGVASAQPPQSAPPPVGGDSVRTVAAPLDGAVGGVAVDRLGTIYVADFGERVFKVKPDGRVSVFVTGLYGSSGNAIDSKGRLVQANFYGNDIWRFTRDGEPTVVAEGLNGPVGLVVNPDDSLIVCNCVGNTLSQVSPDGRVLPFARSELLRCPNGITRGPDGHYYVVNFGDGRVLRVTTAGDVSELAVLPGGGNGHITTAGGDLYATSFRGQRIFRVTLDGDVTPLAGTGAIGETDGPALQATFTFPNGIAAGPTGDRLYVNDFINRFPPSLAAPPAPQSSLRQITFATLVDLMTTALAEGGVEAMSSAYRAWKDNPSHAGAFTEVDVNAFGYRLLGAEQFDEAIAVFALNVESYPASFNTWDSLGEAYMKAGNKAKAIENYEKSLELNPANTNAIEMLKIIRGG